MARAESKLGRSRDWSFPQDPAEKRRHLLAKVGALRETLEAGADEVENEVVVEIKCVERNDPVFEA